VINNGFFITLIIIVTTTVIRLLLLLLFFLLMYNDQNRFKITYEIYELNINDTYVTTDRHLVVDKTSDVQHQL
jgi:hypothetical protein